MACHPSDSGIARGSGTPGIDAGMTEHDVALGGEDAGETPDRGLANTCAMATPLVRGVVLSGQSTIGGGPPSAQCRPSDAPQRFYSFMLPAHYRAEITVTSATDTHLVARALARCDASACLADGETSGSMRSVTLVINSPGDEPLTKIVSVSTTSSGEIGTFSIVLALFPPPPPPASTTCNEAQTLVPGVPLRGQFVAPEGAPFGVCPAQETPQHFYTLLIPPGQRGIVSASPDGGIDSQINPVLRLLRDCGTEQCLDQDWMAHPTGIHVVLGSAAVSYDNRSSAPVTVVAAVSNPAPTARGNDQYNIGAQLQPLPDVILPNSQCSGSVPVPMDPDHNFVILDSALATEAGTPCSGGIPEYGRLLYYTVTVPTGQSLEITLLDSFTLARLRDHCGVDACIAELANTEDNTFLRFTYRNTTGAPKPLVLELGARNALPRRVPFRVQILP
jgi:hypothetical protein